MHSTNPRTDNYCMNRQMDTSTAAKVLLCTLNLILSINRTLCRYITSIFTYIVCGEEEILAFTDRHNLYINTPECVDIKTYQYSKEHINTQKNISILK